ncbi:MAG: tRNA (adenosine(37)-N6)-threonylcarbamoyltransferase complex dimerization subunit type 1 TsaB [Bacteroidota bacterium]
MTQLLLETATEVCSVAVARDGVILAERTATEVHRHASHLTLFIREALEKAAVRMDELEEIVLSDGPGSYTSLRVGAATAKGLCVALPGLRLRVVPTLAALALAARSKDPVLATINSRRGEVYGQLFFGEETYSANEKPGLENIHPLRLEPQNIRLTEPDWWERIATAAGRGYITVVGSGQQRVWDAGGDASLTGFAGPERCSSVHLLAPAAAPQWSRVVDVASYEPFYLNPPFVTKSTKKPLG